MITILKLYFNVPFLKEESFNLRKYLSTHIREYSCPSAQHEFIYGNRIITPFILSLGIRWSIVSGWALEQVWTRWRTEKSLLPQDIKS